MSLRTTVYLSNVTNLSDARYGAGMGVKYLGFPMDGSSALTPEKFSEIASWVSGPERVLEFSASTPETIKAIADECDCSVVCVSDIHLAESLLEQGLHVIFDNKEQIELPSLELDAIFIHTMPGTEHKIESYPMFLAKDIEVDDLDNVLGHPCISGITLFGTDEIRPGYKDYDEIADILEALEED